MNKYVCLRGHVVYSRHDLAGCFCPLCLGAIVSADQLAAIDQILTPADLLPGELLP